jgi:hypothetical protein
MRQWRQLSDPSRAEAKPGPGAALFSCWGSVGVCRDELKDCGPTQTQFAPMVGPGVCSRGGLT